MIRRRSSAWITTALLIALALPALAQDAGGDWDLREDSTRQLSMASLEYEGAPTLAVRCLGGDFNIIVAGLPPLMADQARTVALSVDGRDLGSGWRPLPGGTITTLSSPMAARDLMAGGDAALTVTGPGGARRYRMAAPRNSAVLSRVLTACGVPLSHPRDAVRHSRAGAPGESADDRAQWTRNPAPDFPARGQAAGVTQGHVMLSCYAQADGRLRDCMIEQEYPLDGGFGEAAMAAAEDARLDVSGRDLTTEDGLTLFTVRFFRR